MRKAKKKTIRDLKYRLSEKWFDLTYPIRRFGNGIVNVWKWLPIIWDDKDWDYWHVYKILEFKTNNIANLIEKSDRYEGTEHKVSRMRLLNKLIKRLQEEHYSLECFNYETSTFDFVPTVEVDENGDNYYRMHSEVIEDRLDDYFKKYPLVYKRVVSKLGDQSGRMRIAIHMSRANHERAKRIAFNILNNHVETWWN
jgi:hypothetical protein